MAVREALRASNPLASRPYLVQNRRVSTLAPTMAGALGRHLRMFAAHIRQLAGELSEDEFWTKPYSYGNTFGHLVLHLTGNLNYYIGAQMAGTGYARDREREFGDRSRAAKAQVLDALDEAVAMAVKTSRFFSIISLSTVIKNFFGFRT